MPIFLVQARFTYTHEKCFLLYLQKKKKALKPFGFKAFLWLRGWDLNHMTSGL